MVNNLSVLVESIYSKLNKLAHLCIYYKKYHIFYCNFKKLMKHLALYFGYYIKFGIFIILI